MLGGRSGVFGPKDEVGKPEAARAHLGSRKLEMGSRVVREMIWRTALFWRRTGRSVLRPYGDGE
jgi:hypothetical protein